MSTVNSGGRTPQITARPTLVVIGAITAWLFSIIARWNSYVFGYPNMEATQHYLLTLKALLETKISSSLFLPIVTVSGEINRHIPWGSALPLPNGIYVYTSFSSFGWLWAYLLHKVAKISPSLNSLYLFNLALGLISAILFALIAANLLRNRARTRGSAFVVGAFASAIYLFAPETLLSQGPLIWAQSSSQVYWLIAIYMVTILFKTGRLSNFRVLILIASMAMYSVNEPSGIFATIGSSVFLLVVGIRQRSTQIKRISYTIFITGLATNLLMVAHFSTGVGLQGLLNGLVDRFSARSLLTTEPWFVLISDLFTGTMRSTLPLIIGIGVLTVWFFVQRNGSNFDDSKKLISNLELTVIAFSALPLVENILLLQHAQEFGFDRLKWIIPLGLLFFMIFDSLAAQLKERTRRLSTLVALLVFAAIGSATYYANVWPAAYSWRPVAEQNEIALNWLDGVGGPGLDCATFSTNGITRGYLNNLFGRSVFEEVPSLDLARQRTIDRGGCSTIYIKTREILPDMPLVTSVTIEESKSGRIESKSFNHAPLDWSAFVNR